MSKDLLLISGLSNSGKSTFADFLELHQFATHVPLDKYFHSVPDGTTFLSWVQHQESIDWELLDDHLELLSQGNECFSPVIDAWGSGQRIADGGKASHSKSRQMKPSARYAIPGCLSFEYPGNMPVAGRIYMNTKLATVAARHKEEEVPPSQIHEVLLEHLTEKYSDLLVYKDSADFVISGESSDSKKLEYLELLERKLTCS